MTLDPILIAESHEDEDRIAWALLETAIVAALERFSDDDVAAFFDQTRDKYTFETVN